MDLTLPRRLLRAVLLTSLVAIAAATAARVPAAYAEQRPGWFAGEPIEQRVPAGAEAHAAAAGRAEALGRALGIPGRPGPAARVYNRIEARALDEIDLLDGAGRAVGHFKLDAATGAVRSAVHLDWRPAFDRRAVDATKALARAAQLAGAAGIPVPAGAAGVAWDDGMTAWHVRWTRTVDGVPATGGTSVWVFPGGQLKAIAVAEQPLAAAPAAPIDPAVASAAVRAYIAGNAIERFADLSVGAPVLRWVAPNDFVHTERPDAADATLRLAWVVPFQYRVPDWRLPHQVELYVDAGNGDLIGGAETA